MFPRRPHRKSRHGCRSCKTRRVKCDEIHPACGNCLRKSISCDFSYSTSPSNTQPLERVRISPLQRHKFKDVPHRDASSALDSQSTSVSPSAPPSSPYCPAPISVDTPTDRLLELRLFHHYLKMASTTSASSLADAGHTIGQYTWSIWITELAINTPTLMDALLGFSAFHLRYLNPFDRTISEASHKYMARAITSQAKQLREGIDESNAEGLFATIALTTFHASANQTFLCSDEGECRLPLHWFRPYQCARAILTVLWPWLQNTTIGQLVISPTSPLQPLPRNGEPNKFNFLLDDLDSEEDLDTESAEAYKSAVIYLSSIYATPVYRNILRFTAMVSPRFVELLAGQDPRTLTIVGYYFMLLKDATHIWWVQGAVEKEFKAVMTFLPREWWPMMDWAVQEFGLMEYSKDAGGVTEKARMDPVHTVDNGGRLQG